MRTPAATCYSCLGRTYSTKAYPEPNGGPGVVYYCRGCARDMGELDACEKARIRGECVCGSVRDLIPCVCQEVKECD